MEKVKHIVVRTCSDCPHCDWDRGYDAFFCLNGFSGKTGRIESRFDSVLPDCPLMDLEIPEIEMKVTNYASSSR